MYVDVRWINFKIFFFFLIILKYMQIIYAYVLKFSCYQFFGIKLLILSKTQCVLMASDYFAIVLLYMIYVYILFRFIVCAGLVWSQTLS